MSPLICPSCGVAHGADRRYCLACGALVGRRALDLDQALAFERERQGTPTVPSTARTGAAATTAPLPPVPVAEVSVWRRPATSVLALAALAVGVAGGFLLDPQGGAATGAPAAATGQPDVPTAASTPTTTVPDATAGADEPAAPTADDDAPAPAAADAQAAADAPAAAADDPTAAATPAAADLAEPQAGDATPVAAPTPTTTTATTAAAPSATPARRKVAPSRATKAPADRADGKRDDARRIAAGLPRIDHVWVVGIGTPVAARDGGYLGETLLAEGTELPRYAPAAADPVAGAASLLAGRAPSATAPTIATQLAAAKRPWRAYAPGDPSCADAPTVNPLLAFRTVASAGDCAKAVVGLAALPTDLKDVDAAPAFSYVATDPALDPAALDDQLRQVVEPIRRSAAFRRSGLIAIVPTAAAPGTTTGALLLSPFAAGSTSIGTAFGPYSLLRTFQDLLGLERLGHAADSDVRALGSDVLTPED